MPARNEATVNIRVKIGDQVFTASSKEPLNLSGNRNKWPQQLVDQIAASARFLAIRFEPVKLAVDDD